MVVPLRSGCVISPQIRPKKGGVNLRQMKTKQAGPPQDLRGLSLLRCLDTNHFPHIFFS